MNAEVQTTNVLGKLVSELQSSDVTVGDSEITGTLHYVTGYTGFHGTDPLEQKGNFLALKINASTAEGVTTAVELVGGTKGPVTLDSDMNIVLHIQNKDTESVKVTVSKGGESETKTYRLSGLTLEPEA